MTGPLRRHLAGRTGRQLMGRLDQGRVVQKTEQISLSLWSLEVDGQGALWPKDSSEGPYSSLGPSHLFKQGT